MGMDLVQNDQKGNENVDSGAQLGQGRYRLVVTVEQDQEKVNRLLHEGVLVKQRPSESGAGSPSTVGKS